MQRCAHDSVGATGAWQLPAPKIPPRRKRMPHSSLATRRWDVDQWQSRDVLPAATAGAAVKFYDALVERRHKEDCRDMIVRGTGLTITAARGRELLDVSTVHCATGWDTSQRRAPAWNISETAARAGASPWACWTSWFSDGRRLSQQKVEWRVVRVQRKANVHLRGHPRVHLRSR